MTLFLKTLSNALIANPNSSLDFAALTSLIIASTPLSLTPVKLKIEKSADSDPKYCSSSDPGVN